MKKLTTIFVIIAALLLPATAGCSWLKSEGTKAKDAALDCAHQDLGKTVPEMGASLLMAVVAVIASGGTDWRQALDLLGQKYGAEAVACAAHVAEQLFRPAPTATPSTGAHAESPWDRAKAAVAGRSFK